VVVYQIFDNNSFFGTGDDGTKSLPVKIGGGGDGTYHVPGRLEVADHAVIKALINTSIHLLRTGGEMEKTILSPLPRRIIPCCGDGGHITNRDEPSFKEDMIEHLAEIRAWLPLEDKDEGARRQSRQWRRPKQRRTVAEALRIEGVAR
jgi:hypothetical protein